MCIKIFTDFRVPTVERKKKGGTGVERFGVPNGDDLSLLSVLLLPLSNWADLA